MKIMTPVTPDKRRIGNKTRIHFTLGVLCPVFIICPRIILKIIQEITSSLISFCLWVYNNPQRISFISEN
jgi:hypothetical protein